MVCRMFFLEGQKDLTSLSSRPTQPLSQEDWLWKVVALTSLCARSTQPSMQRLDVQNGVKLDESEPDCFLEHQEELDVSENETNAAIERERFGS